MKRITFPFPTDIQHYLPGQICELPSSTNWMKLWRLITLELKQSSIWFIPNFMGNIFAKVLKKRWSKDDLEKVIKSDCRFCDFNDEDIHSIWATIILDLEKFKKDWIIIKCDYDFVEKNKEQLQRIANFLNTRVVLICKKVVECEKDEE